MEYDDLIAASFVNVVASTAMLLLLLRYKRRKHCCWVKGYLKMRRSVGAFNCLVPDLLVHDPVQFKNYLRMDFEQFEYIFSIVQESITTRDTTFRKAIPAREKLAAALRILATGKPGFSEGEMVSPRK